MHFKRILIYLLLFSGAVIIKAQDTFSILAFDSITREIGAAGASCVDLDVAYPLAPNDFICEILPDTGAIATQASYNTQNQINARNTMRTGNSPQQVINWLVANDATSPAAVATRQYGVVRLDGPNKSAGYTGANCLAYKNHISGPNYSIQGNILISLSVLDSMEARFLQTEGDLACKLMAAMQGAKRLGADSRCAQNGTSSLFAFLKVSQPQDAFANPDFIISVRTSMNDRIEPIDSLAVLFDMEKNCKPVSTTGLHQTRLNSPQMTWDAISKSVVVRTSDQNIRYHLTVHSVSGALILDLPLKGNGLHNLSYLPAGMYIVQLKSDIYHKINKICLVD